jgi:CheY-like chemotaxis protein
VDRQPSVLIVDESEDTREVLQTALERRGWRTLAASGCREGVALARRHRPDLIVVDLETDDAAAEGLGDAAASPGRADGPVVILLGSVRPARGRFARGEFLSKPYHYGALIRRIEESLQHVSRAAARVA